MRTRDVMTREPVTVRPGSSARDAAATLVERGFTMLPVVDDEGFFRGVVTETDLLHDRLPVDPRPLVYRRVDPERAVPPVLVSDAMSRPAVVAEPAMDVADLAELMLEHGVRSAPVLDGGRLAGVVTRRDLLRVISRHDRLVESEVRHRLGRYADPARWRVSVVEGQVEVLDDLDDDEDRHVIRVLAEAVPGVVRVRVTKAEHAADHG